jgi:hypothetical protein
LVLAAGLARSPARFWRHSVLHELDTGLFKLWWINKFAPILLGMSRIIQEYICNCIMMGIFNHFSICSMSFQLLLHPLTLHREQSPIRSNSKMAHLKGRTELEIAQLGWTDDARSYGSLWLEFVHRGATEKSSYGGPRVRCIGYERKLPRHQFF